MTKSKRDKRVSLTRTKKKVGMEPKKALISKVREAVEKFRYIYVFSVDNSRSAILKTMRTEWSHSRFCLGKNKVMQLALGRTEADALAPGLSELAALLHHEKGVLLTNQRPAAVTEFFARFCQLEYARTGVAAPQGVRLVAGPLPNLAGAPMEPWLRKLGLPVSLERGVLRLDRGHRVCVEGERLQPEQCHILKTFQQQLSEFRVILVAHWDKETGLVTQHDAAASAVSTHACGEATDISVSVERLDDGQYYFVPTPIEDANDDEDVEMSTTEPTQEQTAAVAETTTN